MTELNLPEIDQDWESTHPLFCTVSLPHDPLFRPLSTTWKAPLDVYPLSPVVFEESSIDQLWAPTQSPAKPLPSLTSAVCITAPRKRSGLKALSAKVQEIMTVLKESSYKQVADELLQSFAQSEVPVKDEKNVRRRVYDALNVLVAAKVLTKTGKIVRVPGSVMTTTNFDEKPATLRAKKQTLAQLINTYTALRNLYERNTMHSNTGQVVPYPLTLVALGKGTLYDVNARQMQLTRTRNSVQLNLELTGTSQVLEPPTVLRQLGLHKQSTQLPPELVSFLSID